MNLGKKALDQIFANARRLAANEHHLPCTLCAATLPLELEARACPDCGAFNVVFRSCALASDAIAALRKKGAATVAPTSYVPGLGWVVGFKRASVRAA